MTGVLKNFIDTQTSPDRGGMIVAQGFNPGKKRDKPFSPRPSKNVVMKFHTVARFMLILYQEIIFKPIPRNVRREM